MQSQCFSSSLSGVEARLVRVEGVVSAGLPGLTVVGLPDATVSEAGARVRSALKLSGFSLPPRRMIINLSPADVRKSGSGFDLALALALLESLEEIPRGSLSEALVVGELSLGGELRETRGIVSSVALAAERPELKKLLFPACQSEQIPDWSGVELVPVSSLEEAVAFCRGKWKPIDKPGLRKPISVSPSKLHLVRGQALGKLALEVTAAGGHHLSLVGPPGCGKSLLASCLPSILPPMSESEQREVAVIQSVCQSGCEFSTRPFRAPGNSVTPVALLGGYLPGEVTRAHNGVLFLDEFAEFRRDSLESLRTVLEEGRAFISRARAKISYPAKFTLVCAMNPCPCGHHGCPKTACSCTSAEIRRYQSKLSGPLMDRIDMLVNLDRVPLEEMNSANTEGSQEDTSSLLERIKTARELQSKRGFLNRDLQSHQFEKTLGWNPSDRRFSLETAEFQQLSVRSYQKWLRVARTLADLKAKASVTREELLIARSLRSSMLSSQK